VEVEVSQKRREEGRGTKKLTICCGVHSSKNVGPIPKLITKALTVFIQQYTSYTCSIVRESKNKNCVIREMMLA
jgi:hypothetical protein